MATNSVVLKFAKLSENATTPTRGSSQSAGYDLYRYSLINESINKVSISDVCLWFDCSTHIYIYGYYVKLILHYYFFFRKEWGGGGHPGSNSIFSFYIYVGFLKKIIFEIIISLKLKLKLSPLLKVYTPQHFMIWQVNSNIVICHVYSFLNQQEFKAAALMYL